MKVHVDTRACSGHARCWSTAPDVYRINDDGYNDSEDYAVEPGQEAAASRGALSCPEGAISLLDQSGAEIPQPRLQVSATLPRTDA